MQITLRRANAVQASIQEVLKSIELTTSVSVNEFENSLESIAQANLNLHKDYQRKSDLLHALYSIRGSVGQANSRSGIDDKLTAASFIAKRLEQMVEFIAAEARTDQKVIEAKLDKIRNAKETYYDSKTVTTGVLSASEIEDFKRIIQNLKKQKVVLSDEILALNVSTVVTLDDTTVTVLTKENLL